MCLSCLSEMNHAFAFKQKCERSEKTLRVYLEQAKATNDEIQIKVTQIKRIVTTSPNESDAKWEAEENQIQSAECQSSVLGDQTDDGTLHHGNVCECTNCQTTLQNDCEQNEQQAMDYPHAEQIEYIQAEEQIESTLMKYEANGNGTEEAVKDFIAENTLKFICSHCKASFSSRRSLKLHENGRKCMQLSYECDICHKIFIKKRYLIRHLQRMHRMTSESEPATVLKVDSKRKYKCHLCPKGERISSNSILSTINSLNKRRFNSSIYYDFIIERPLKDSYVRFYLEFCSSKYDRIEFRFFSINV